MGNPGPENWRELYAAACAEMNSAMQWTMIMQTQTAMLERARFLEDCGLDDDPECVELEKAADVIAHMKQEHRGSEK